MEKRIETVGKVYELDEGRTSSNNMLCVVTYEPLPEDVQVEVDQILAV